MGWPVFGAAVPVAAMVLRRERLPRGARTCGTALSSVALVPLLTVAAPGAPGTGPAVLVRYGLVAEVGPTTARPVTCFIPVVATGAGVVVPGEPLRWTTPVGAVVVLAGAALTRVRAAG